MIAQRAYPNLGPDAQETLALHQLYKIIPIEMKCRCIDRDCTTIATAVQIIERYEALLGDSTDRKRTTIRAIDSQFNRKRPDSGRDTSHTSRMDDPLHQVMDRLAKLENYPDTRNAGYRTQQNKPMGGRGMPRPIRRRCYACDSDDHFMRECPIYQKFMAETRRAATNNGSENSIPPSF